ncbi:MAG: hypothetical protein K0R55_3153 [Sporomusa sp.]|nr:hypothetical protein [Sporomusa sp.]
MFVRKKCLWIGIVIFMYCLPTVVLGVEKTVNPTAITTNQEYGDDIQSMVRLCYGSRGEDVKLIQSFLIKNGFLADKIDGMFGSLTLQAVKRFQSVAGLPVDGVVTGYTFHVLKAYKPAAASISKEEPAEEQVSAESPAVIRRKMNISTTSRGSGPRTTMTQTEAVAPKNKDKQPTGTKATTLSATLPQSSLQSAEEKVYKNTGGISDKKAASDIPIHWRPLSVEATAYTKYDAGCTAYTYRGNYLQRGLVAVDPTVIPLGTRLYIPGYGFAVADDIGGAIKGHKIDLSMDTLNEAFTFGRRRITIYVIDWSFLL